MEGNKANFFAEVEKILEYEERKKVLLIYNPKSGNGVFPNYLDLIIRRFQERGFLIRPIRGTEHRILDYAFSHIHQEQYRQIIVAGGDGTINIVVNAMVKYNIDLPIAIFPSGTANDFAYYMNIPHDINAMIDVALGDQVAYADVAKMNDKCYINVAAMGTLVDVSQKTDPNLKNTLGVTAYYIKGLSEIVNLHAIPVSLRSNECNEDIEMYFMIVMNGCSAGGFRRVAPESDISDGLLDVIVFKKMKLHEMAPIFFEVLSGNHPQNKNVLYFKTNDLYLESPEDVSTDVDGERGEKFPLHFTVLHKRLRIFYAEPEKYFDDEMERYKYRSII